MSHRHDPQGRRRAVSDRPARHARRLAGQGRALGRGRRGDGRRAARVPRVRRHRAGGRASAPEVSGNLEATLQGRRRPRARARRPPPRARRQAQACTSSSAAGPSRKGDGPLRQRRAARHARRAASACRRSCIMTPFERDWGISPGDAGARVRYRARPHRHRHLLRQRVSAARARHGRGRRRGGARPLVHRAHLGLPPRAHGRAGARAREPDRHRA